MMNRREFMKVSGGLFAVSALGGALGGRTKAAQASHPDIRSLFEWEDPAVIRLTEDVFQKCILGKVFPAEAPLQHNWIAPGGGYRGQWIWDTMFVVDLLSILPGQEKVIRDVFQNYWDFQLRWNEAMPDYAHDMIPCMIEPGKKDWVKFPAYSQIPILAWGVERVYQRNGDKKLVAQCLDPLERFHEWYWRERDVANIGLTAVGAYSGVTQHARFETFDYECNMDDLKMTRHPTRQGAQEGAWYGDICVPGNTAYLVLGETCLLRLAQRMGKQDMAARRQARIDKAIAAMRKHMWDQDAGTFLSVERDTLKKVPVATIGSWMPLHAGIATQAQAQRMAHVLGTSSWQTPLPVPTVDPKDKRFQASGFWRGDVWPPTNYQIAMGLAAYGYAELASDIADKTVANAIKNGISEHYDSMSGRTLGVDFLGMTCTVVTMMLDGLCSRHSLKIRKMP
jgi:glycogen debranching enzyme